MQTTLFSKLMIGLLSILGIFYIAQLITNYASTEKITENPTSTKVTASKNDMTNGNEESDPTLIIPDNAKIYLKEKFSMSDINVEWVKRPYGIEAIFKQNARSYEVEFDAKGNWLETELEDVPTIEIPVIIIEAAKKVHPSAQISEYEIEITPKGTFYEVEMQTDNGEVELYFDNKGNRVKNENEDK